MKQEFPGWFVLQVVQDVNPKKFLNEGVIVVEDNHDVIHDNNSSDLALSTSLNDLDFATLNIDGKSTDVEALRDIVDVDEEDDIIDDEDGVSHDLTASDDEVLANDDDDDVMLAAVARGHGGDCGGDGPSQPLPCPIGTGFRGMGGRKATRGGKGGDRDGGSMGTTKKPRTLYSTKP
nr:hypothetical protein [Tanacetum cinerariifolium]